MELDPTTLDWANKWYDLSSKLLLWFGSVSALLAVATVFLAFVQWRTSSIREQHSHALTAVLSGLAPGNLECAVLLAKIEMSLYSAGWKHQPISGEIIVINRDAKPPAKSATVSNIVVGFAPQSEAKLAAPALALGNALHKEGLTVTVERMTAAVDPKNALDIFVMVGPKL